MKTTVWIALVFAALGLLVPMRDLRAQSAPEKAPSSSTSKKTAAAKAAPSAQEIADAKTKGLVWVNTATHVYHKDGPSYGTTKRGKFLTEEDAKKAGFRMAQEPGSKNVRKQ